jgi:hypothetical protein
MFKFIGAHVPGSLPVLFQAMPTPTLCAGKGVMRKVWSPSSFFLDLSLPPSVDLALEPIPYFKYLSVSLPLCEEIISIILPYQNLYLF